MRRLVFALIAVVGWLLVGRVSIARAQTPTPPPPITVTVPILLYHHVGNLDMERSASANARFDVRAEDFDAQMAYLVANGYTAVTIDQIADALGGGAVLPPNPVAITFDDGNQDAYDNAFPILQKYRLTATFLVVTNRIDKPHYLSSDELTTLYQAGMRIGSHSVSHPYLNALSWAKLRDQLVESKADLEARLQVPVTVFAYPYGRAPAHVLRAAKDAGYLAALGTGPPTGLHTSAQRFYLARIAIYGDTTLAQFAWWLTYAPAVSPARRATTTAPAPPPPVGRCARGGCEPP